MGASLNSDRRRRQAPRRFLLFGISFRLAPNARRKGAGMFVLSVELRIKPENVESFMAKALENAAQSRKEPGCRQFEVLVDPKEPTRAMLYEVYVDEKAFDAHQQTAHFKKYLAEAVPLLATRERHVWKRAARGRLVPAARPGEALRPAAEEARRAERGRAGRRARHHLPDREEPGPVDPEVYRTAVKTREGRSADQVA